MRTVFGSLALLIMCAAITPRADACSPASEDAHSDLRLAEVFDGATTVVVAKLANVSRRPMSGRLRDIGIVEDAWFVVLETLKGPHKIGETIHVRAEFTPGPCGINVLNDPPWIYESVDEGPEADLRPMSLSETWLIYGRDEEPYDITLGYSSPMNVRGSRQLEIHRKIMRSRERENGT